jgi:outer membrane protein OmpA-like peptidoglycan-associated protein
MKIKKIMLSAMLLLGCASMSAQEQAKTEYVFNPHWYVQAQVGGQYTLGEIGFSDLLSPNAQIGLGYNFNPVFGLRLAVNAWQSKAGSSIYGTDYKWKWNYVAPALDVTFNLSNLFCGYNPNRVVSVGIFGGIGANVAFKNDEAQTVNKQIAGVIKATDDQALRLLWSGTKTRLMGQFGANVDFRLSDAVSLGIEAQASTLNDHYNSKKAGNSDWYFNALVGIKCTLGKTHTTRTIAPAYVAPAQERVVEKIVEKKIEVEKQETLRRDVFFTINSTEITIAEMQKVKEIAEYLNKYPNAKVDITGYADKGTGNQAINNSLSAKRAKAVVDTLVNKYSISSSRITSSSKGDSEQPFAEQILNRVSICIAK